MMRRRDMVASLAAAAAIPQSPRRYQIGAYCFPNYHVYPRNEEGHGKGWTEWELVKRAEPRFPGHYQPRRPLWGYEDESDPRVFARKIDAAADHGLTHFLFDWYWYDDGPFLARCLEQGFLRAPNASRLGFALMWANHDWVEIHPAKLNTTPPVLYKGAVTRATFDGMTDYIISKYFSHPSYWKIDGAPYFSIYELYRLVQGLGGVDPARQALGEFRRKTKAAGFRDLHLNAVTWGVQILPGEQQIKEPAKLLSHLEFNSGTSYVWIHHAQLPDFPVTAYAYAAKKAQEYWQRASGEIGLPYHPNVTMGWDSSPRTCQSDVFTNKGYPFMPTLGGGTPEAFMAALEAVKRFLDSRPDQPRIFNINAWNEWTEGSYLEPDTVRRMGYLNAIRDVFARG